MTLTKKKIETNMTTSATVPNTTPEYIKAMEAQRKQREAQQYSTYTMFGRITGLVAMGSLVVSWFTGSIIPMVVAMTGLFLLLSFINRLG